MKLLILLLPTITLISLKIVVVNSFPEYFCNVGGINDCGVAVTPGTTIRSHGRISATTSTAATLTITRGATALVSGTSYVASESLSFSISAPSGNYVFITTTGATFTGGYCTGKNRLYADKTTLTGTIIMPTTGTVQVWILWSNSASVVITSSPYFILNAPVSPSFAPTPLPSSTPLNPSFLPSFKPTTLPSSLPSLAPISPSFPPSSTPSLLPSPLPSFSPSTLPTVNPSTLPSVFPTGSPSFSPTLLPTNLPSFSPSIRPTLYPSSVPTLVPTMKPSSMPLLPGQSLSPSTVVPTGRPTTFKPTVIPTTAIPSFRPTSMPSSLPTKAPSFLPSSAPSLSPSSIPTKLPTQIPTKYPSTVPSLSPTIRPSNPPTASPSLMPIATPSIEPTDTPSFFPTATPFFSPTSAPTLKQTSFLTTEPTFEPSLEPTRSPSNKPTMKPTKLVASTQAPSNKGNTVVSNNLQISSYAAALYGGAIGGVLLISIVLCCLIKRYDRNQATATLYKKTGGEEDAMSHIEANEGNDETSPMTRDNMTSLDRTESFVVRDNKVWYHDKALNHEII